LLAALGAGSYLGGWNAGLAGNPSWAGQSDAPFAKPELMENATAQERADFEKEQRAYYAKLKKWREDTPLATRNAAIMGASSLLIGLVGSVIGGWLASGEPIFFASQRTEPAHGVAHNH